MGVTDSLDTEHGGQASVLEVLDPEFGPTAPLDVPVIEEFGRLVPGGDDKAGIRSLLEPLRLVDHAAFLLPGAGRVPALPQQARLLVGPAVLRLGRSQALGG